MMKPMTPELSIVLILVKRSGQKRIMPQPNPVAGFNSGTIRGQTCLLMLSISKLGIRCG